MNGKNKLSDAKTKEDINYSIRELKIAIEAFTEGKLGNDNILTLLQEKLADSEAAKNKKEAEWERNHQFESLLNEILEALFMPYNAYIEVSDWRGSCCSEIALDELLGIESIRTINYDEGNEAAINVIFKDGLFKQIRNPLRVEIYVGLESGDYVYPYDWETKVHNATNDEIEALKKLKGYTKPLQREVDKRDYDTKSLYQQYITTILPKIGTEISEEDYDKALVLYLLSEDITYFQQLLEE